MSIQHFLLLECFHGRHHNIICCASKLASKRPSARPRYHLGMHSWKARPAFHGAWGMGYGWQDVRWIFCWFGWRNDVKGERGQHGMFLSRFENINNQNKNWTWRSSIKRVPGFGFSGHCFFSGCQCSAKETSWSCFLRCCTPQEPTWKPKILLLKGTAPMTYDLC